MIRRFARTMPPERRSVATGALPASALLASVLLACAFVPSAQAQQPMIDGQGGAIATTSVPVVQSTTPTPTRLLNAALARLARDPRDMAALVDAGSAALDLGDTDAAIGFFTRAEEVSPGNGMVRARIGAAMLSANQPFEAIRWFDSADQTGADRVAMATDRGLAYDLIGDNAAAQRQYQLALAGRQNDEASRRYALSLVIGGDRRGAELVIQPLLERRDRGAWRVRTFIMAIAGQSDEAEGIARATMPADLAASISPYLRYMPRLTSAQQAAAANLGRFPRAADIGRDDPQVVQYAALHPRAPRVDAGLVPTGAALGGKNRDDRSKRRRPGRDSGRESGRETALAAARPAVMPPAVSAPWGLQPGSPSPKPAPTPAPNMATPPATQPRPATAPVVLSRLDVPPGTQMTAAPQPQLRPAPVVQTAPASASAPASGPPQPVLRPAPQPAPGVQVAQVSVPVPQPSQPAPVPAPGLTLVPTATQAPTPTPTPAPAPTLAPAPTPTSTLALATLPAAATPKPEPASSQPLPSAPETALTPAAPVLVPVPTSVSASVPISGPAPAPADFRSTFDGFKPPEQEAAATTAAVDLAQIETLRQAAAKTSSAGKTSRANAKQRGDRPDGPVSVSRTSDDESPASGSPAPGSKAAKAAADADRKLSPKEKAAKEKAAFDKACAETKAGKGKTGKSSKAAAGKKGAKDPVCETNADKTGKGAKAQLSHASRIWVQVLTGANREGMGREWQRLVREAALLKGRKPYVTPWRSNFRLLTGPFDSSAAAQSFVGQLRKDGVSGFEWTSPAGQAVDSLQVK